MLDSYVQWGNEAVAWVQTFRTPALDMLFDGTSYLGDSKLLVPVIAVLYWIVDRRLGFALAFLFLLGSYFSVALKEILEVPRPSGSNIVAFDDFDGYSLPSAHAQNATTMWGYIAVAARRLWLWPIVVAIVSVVSLSRVYMGGHFPGDVAVGVALGIVALIVFVRMRDSAAGGIVLLPAGVQMVAASAVAVPLLLLAPRADAASGIVLLWAFLVGWAVEARYLPVAASATRQASIVRAMIGGIGLAVIVALELVLEAVPGIDVLSAGVIGAWITLGAPYLFAVVKMARGTAPARRRVRGF